DWNIFRVPDCSFTFANFQYGKLKRIFSPIQRNELDRVEIDALGATSNRQCPFNLCDVFGNFKLFLLLIALSPRLLILKKKRTAEFILRLLPQHQLIRADGGCAKTRFFAHVWPFRQSDSVKLLTVDYDRPGFSKHLFPYSFGVSRTVDVVQEV